MVKGIPEMERAPTMDDVEVKSVVVLDDFAPLAEFYLGRRIPGDEDHDGCVFAVGVFRPALGVVLDLGE